MSDNIFDSHVAKENQRGGAWGVDPCPCPCLDVVTADIWTLCTMGGYIRFIIGNKKQTKWKIVVHSSIASTHHRCRPESSDCYRQWFYHQELILSSSRKQQQQQLQQQQQQQQQRLQQQQHHQEETGANAVVLAFAWYS